MSLFPLPPLIFFDDYDGDWEKYKQSLYNIFINTVVNKLTFMGLPVSCRYFQPIGDMHRCFWHLITEGSKNDEDRTPDFRRCERITWITHLIHNYKSLELKCWENKRGSNKNTVLWLPCEDYMIVLSYRKKYYLLTTAYVHHPSKRRANQRESEVFKDPRIS